MTAEEWLAAWDANEIVHTVSMGGMGPGYEQCIQIMVAEFLRSMLKNKPDTVTWREPEQWKKTCAQIEENAKECISKLGPSVAQFGAAMNLSTAIYARGPDAVLAEVDADRRVMCQRIFPQL